MVVVTFNTPADFNLVIAALLERENRLRELSVSHYTMSDETRAFYVREANECARLAKYIIHSR